jgi:hypothetical protein
VKAVRNAVAMASRMAANQMMERLRIEMSSVAGAEGADGAARRAAK